MDENIENGLPPDYGLTAPDLDAKILSGMLKKTNGKKREKGEVDISKVKIQHD